jgi:hypothetical protein
MGRHAVLMGSFAVRVCRIGMLPSFLMLTLIVVMGGLVMVMGCGLMVGGGLLMMVAGGMSCH